MLLQAQKKKKLDTIDPAFFRMSLKYPNHNVFHVFYCHPPTKICYDTAHNSQFSYIEVKP